MDFVDLKAQQKRIKEEVDMNIQKVWAHGNYIMGPEIKELESKLAVYAGTKYAVSCASGTDALLMALMALNISSSDAVFTTPFTLKRDSKKLRNGSRALQKINYTTSTFSLV